MEIIIEIETGAAMRMLQRTRLNIDRAMRAGMSDATTLLLKDMKTYPRQRQGGTYRRTGTLKRSWSRRITGSGFEIVGVVGSNSDMAPYNRLVQDRTVQSRIHQGRWQTVQSVAEQRDRAIREMFATRMSEFLR